ncbi:MAG: metallophosphoesterase family protein [Chloroflexi bacterium]|nr:metallophosphoesterase family protein [Chloroflexota bacterium]
MRIAVVSDIHANLAAFEAVIADLQGVDEVWCLGDVVGYGPDPNACVSLLRAQNHLCIAGNHDWAAIGRIKTDDFNPDAAAAIDWTASHLATDSLRYLESLPLEIEKHGITLAHGSPREPIWEYLLSPTIAQANLSHFGTAYCFVGHTHIPVIYSCHAPTVPDPSLVGIPVSNGACIAVEPTYDAPLQLAQDRLIVNPGSVGQPRDGIPEARYIVLDLDQRTISYRRISYDIEATQRKMQAANLPTRLWMRLSYGW